MSIAQSRSWKLLAYNCTRAAGSLSIFDIVEVSRQGVRLIQVKTNRLPCPAEQEIIELFDEMPEMQK
jgi:hypothetical protein